jgi:predicted phage terminase large subunit-like protein
MDNEQIIDRLLHTDLTQYGNLCDLFEMCRNIQEENKPRSIRIVKAIRDRANKLAREDTKFYELYIRCLLFLAPDDFDSYLLYVEHKRPVEKQFYLPRRHVLKIIVQDLQDLEEGVIDFLGVSLPPRVGKSTTCIFYMTWQMGKYPEKANLVSGHSDPLTKGFFKDALNIITSEEYCWGDVFPTAVLENKSEEYENIQLHGSSVRFPTLTCRSIEGTTTGAVEAANLLYTDDLIKDRKESVSPKRLEDKYQDYLNKVLDRKLDNAKELMVGTRWNVSDPLGKLQAQNKDNPRYRFRVIPALDENDESNFVYKYNLGFSTQYYRNLRDTLDRAEWMAKYQGKPFKREGLIFPEDELTYYNGVLPGTEPDMVISACDVAWGGGDSLSMPFLYVYGDTGYVHDVIFNTGDKTVTRPIVVGRIVANKAQMVRFEANNGGHEYADNVDRVLREGGYHCNITSRTAPGKNGKIARIVQWAPDIKKMVFINDKHASKEYRAFMSELTSLVQIGTNEHDDSGDSLAQLAAFWLHGTGSCEPMQRPW